MDGDASIDKYQDEASGKTLSSLRIVQSMCFLYFWRRGTDVIR